MHTAIHNRSWKAFAIIARATLPVILAFLAALLLLTFVRPLWVGAQGIIYVKTGATGKNDGTTWEDAFTSLQDAMQVAVAGDEIWVAAGVYYPDEGMAQIEDDRNASYQLDPYVTILGGFTGTETKRDARDWENQITVLSGDIDQNDATDLTGVVTDTDRIGGSNAYHVVNVQGVTEAAILDGFTITAGKADGVGCPGSDCGGGVMVTGALDGGGSLTFRNLAIRGNYAGQSGGGIYVAEGNFTLSDVDFYDNQAGSKGGGLYATGPTGVTLTRTTFVRNTAAFGGGMYDATEGRLTQMDQVTFTVNMASQYGGGLMSRGSGELRDGLFSENQARYGGGMYVHSQDEFSLERVDLIGNRVSGKGGGLYSRGITDDVYNSMRFAHVNLNGNSANNGGGLYGWLTAISAEDVAFRENEAVDGAGAYFSDFELDAQRIAFIENHATDRGGGLVAFANSRSTTITDAVFIGNQSAFDSGGAYFCGELVLTNAIFSGNHTDGVGGGYLGVGDQRFSNVSVWGNSAGEAGGGMVLAYTHDYELTNVILWGNIAPYDATLCNYPPSPQLCNYEYKSVPIIRNSIIQDSRIAGTLWDWDLGIDGGANQNADPLFIDPDGADDIAGTSDDDLHLRFNSPAIDRGTDDAISVSTDLDGRPRISGSTVDIGAYEFGLSVQKTAQPSIDVPYHGTVTYTLVLKNDKLEDEAFAIMTDSLPAEVKFDHWIEKPALANQIGNEIQWSGSLNAGTAITFTYAVTNMGDYGDTVVNTAYYSGSVLLEGSCSYRVAMSDLSIEKRVNPAEASPGEVVTFTLVFTNDGSAIATGVVITDTMPDEVIESAIVGTAGNTPILREGTTFIWDLASLHPGEGGTITLTGVISTPMPAGSLANLATISRSQGEEAKGNNESSSWLTVANVPPTVQDRVETTIEDAEIGGVLLATDANGDPISFVLEHAPEYGVALVDEQDGFWFYWPANRMDDYTDSFTVTATDDGGRSAMGRVSVNVGADNDPPTISEIRDQQTAPDTPTRPIEFTVSDPETDPTNLMVDAIASNLELLPPDGIRLDGEGAYRSIHLTPTLGLRGRTIITLTVTDERGLTDDTSFTLTVANFEIFLPIMTK